MDGFFCLCSFLGLLTESSSSDGGGLRRSRVWLDVERPRVSKVLDALELALVLGRWVVLEAAERLLAEVDAGFEADRDGREVFARVTGGLEFDCSLGSGEGGTLAAGTALREARLDLWRIELSDSAVG